MITKTRIGNHLRRHALGDQPTFRQGFKEGVAFAQKHAALAEAHSNVLKENTRLEVEKDAWQGRYYAVEGKNKRLLEALNDVVPVLDMANHHAALCRIATGEFWSVIGDALIKARAAIAAAEWK